MTCKDCVHYEVCNIFGDEVLGNFDICVHFKDKSKFIELNCKLFQYDSERIYELKVKKIIYDCGYIAFDNESIGKNVFLTKEEAEQALRSQQ